MTAILIEGLGITLEILLIWGLFDIIRLLGR